MAKCVITIEDKDNGKVGFTTDFDPEVKVNQKDLTVAQIIGLRLLNEALNFLSGSDEETDEED